MYVYYKCIVISVHTTAFFRYTATDGVCCNNPVRTALGIKFTP